MVRLVRQVKDGRWGFTEMPSLAENRPDGLLSDVYDKMRAPWNTNARRQELSVLDSLHMV